MENNNFIPTIFEFSTANRIIFGNGTIQQIGSIISSFGKNKKVLIITGKNKERSKILINILEKQEIQFITFTICEEPTVEIANEGLKIARENNCEIVVGFGGGSVIDTGKAIAALLTNGGEFIDYLEVIGKNLPITKPSAPFIAIPTTSGTGAEVTRNSVLCSKEHKQKVSLRSIFMLPNIALIDPELTITLPKHITASTGLDALTQVLESFVSNKSNPLTDAICREGLKRGSRSLKIAYLNGNDKRAREDMSITSLFGGLALANSKLGAVHGFAGPIGGMFPNTPHGAICASLLPNTMEININALKNRNPTSNYLKKYDEIAKIITNNYDATAMDGVQWIKQLCKDLNIPSLSFYGIKKDDFSIIIEKSIHSSSMQGNPIVLTKEELLSILELSF